LDFEVLSFFVRKLTNLGFTTPFYNPGPDPIRPTKFLTRPYPTRRAQAKYWPDSTRLERLSKYSVNMFHVVKFIFKKCKAL